MKPAEEPVLASMPIPNRILREAYLERKTRNPRYSTRSFARDLGVSHTYACLMLVGKRKVPAKQAARLAALLKLTTEQSDRFLGAVRSDLVNAVESKIPNSKKSPRFMELELDRFKTIQNWYHTAILDLTLIEGFKPQVKWVAKKLGLTALEVQDAVERLSRLGLLEVSAKAWTKTSAKLFFATTKSEAGIRTFHTQMMERAQLELGKSDEAAFKRREISGMTLALRADRVDEAKRRIREFQRDLADFVTEGDADALYQLNVQFFPLTQD